MGDDERESSRHVEDAERRDEWRNLERAIRTPLASPSLRREDAYQDADRHGQMLARDGDRRHDHRDCHDVPTDRSMPP